MAYKTNKSPLNQFGSLTGAVSVAAGQRNQRQSQQQGIFSGTISSNISRLASQAAQQGQAALKPKKEINTHLDKYKTDKANYAKDLEAKNARNNPYDLASNFVEPYKPMANGQRNPWDAILKPPTQQMNPKATGNNNTVKGVFGQEQVPGSYNRSMSPLNQMQDANPILPPTDSEPIAPPSAVDQPVVPNYDLSNI